MEVNWVIDNHIPNKYNPPNIHWPRTLGVCQPYNCGLPWVYLTEWCVSTYAMNLNWPWSAVMAGLCGTSHIWPWKNLLK